MTLRCPICGFEAEPGGAELRPGLVTACPRCNDIQGMADDGTLYTMTPAEVEAICRRSPGFVFAMAMLLEAQKVDALQGAAALVRTVLIPDTNQRN